MTNKPREFWIDDSNGYLYRNGIDSAKNEIHVIEYSAITELRAENEALNEKSNRLEASLKVLQRYHSGDGTVTREDVFNALSILEGR